MHSLCFPSNMQLSFDIFFFLSIGRVPTTWPANNCLQIMICSCVVSSKRVLLQTIFCSCVIGATFSRENGGLLPWATRKWLRLRLHGKPPTQTFLDLSRTRDKPKNVCVGGYLHGCGQSFARTKTCTVLLCVYTGPLELDEVLNGYVRKFGTWFFEVPNSSSSTSLVKMQGGNVQVFVFARIFRDPCKRV